MAITITTLNESFQPVTIQAKELDTPNTATSQATKETTQDNSEDTTNNTEVETTNDNDAGSDELDYFNSSEEEEETDDEDSNFEEDEQPKTKKSGYQKRIDRQNDKIRELEEKLNLALQNKNTTKEENQDKPAKTTSKELKEPIQEDFETYDQYVKALAKYEVAKEYEDKLSEQREAEVKAEGLKILGKYQERLAEAQKTYYKDWKQVTSQLKDVSNLIQQEIMTSELGPHVLYYLARNPKENERINALTPNGQIRAVVEIERKLAAKIDILAKSKKDGKVSSAPTPPKPLNSSNSSSSSNKKPEDMTAAEYKAWREKKAK